MRIVEAGGGGFGDPRQRAAAAVAEDVAQGYVSDGTAREIYGWRG
jgi:N-methylhydantoinase B